MTRKVGLMLVALAMGVACSEDAADPPDQVVERDPEFVQPPISGGTLLITRDGLWAVAADPDADRISIVGISSETPGCNGKCGSSPQLLATVEVPIGEEPGRLVEDDYGRVHVVLRRGGAIATIDLASGEQLARRPVCVAPRGIAYDETAKLLHVACASGELVSLTPDSGEITRRIALDVDLRDVVVVPDGLVVSRFKSAQLIRLDHDGNLLERVKPVSITRAPQGASFATDPLDPGVAWRIVKAGTDIVFVMHQYALARPIDLEEMPGSAAPYGPPASSKCGGIVAQTVSTLMSSGGLMMGSPLPSVALSVDVAASSDGTWLAVAHPGAANENDKVTLYAAPVMDQSPVPCAAKDGSVIVGGQPVAVAMHPVQTPAAAAASDWLVVQTRNPAQLLFYNDFAGARASVALMGPVGDVGHDLFHLEAGTGIACAQCHPEGTEDGRVWTFEPIGSRRTQAVNVGLERTAPFHWDGDLATLEDLIAEVMVRRMGRAEPSASEVESLVHWLGALRPPAPIVDPDAEAAVRGRLLFESEAVGCASCHDGPAVAKNFSVDVGVESPLPFQVPALRGVGYRAPFMHNGCAPTLRARFDSPCGGGDSHGKTSQLAPHERDDLVAYLESL